MPVLPLTLLAAGLNPLTADGSVAVVQVTDNAARVMRSKHVPFGYKFTVISARQTETVPVGWQAWVCESKIANLSVPDHQRAE